MAFNPEAPNFDRFPGRRDYPILLEPFADPYVIMRASSPLSDWNRSRISQPLMAFNSEAVNFNRLAGRREYPILIEPYVFLCIAKVILKSKNQKIGSECRDLQDVYHLENARVKPL